MAGIDPGTITFDLCVLDGGAPVAEATFASAALGADPAPLVEALLAHGPFDLVLGPAGYGLPLVEADRLGDAELALMLLVRSDERGRDSGVAGLRALIRALVAAGLPVVFGPGVVHLATVPAHRKWNRIDLGTADKVAAAALAVADQARRHGVTPAQTSLIVLELGGAFSAALAVDGGAIVDGLGGSSGPIGARACGALDAEVAYLLGGALTKATVFSGGALDADGRSVPGGGAALEALWRDPARQEGWEALLEGAARAALGLTVSVPAPREVVVSGRLAALPELVADLAGRLAHVAPVVPSAGLGSGASAAAEGAALLADGLAGGRHAPLVRSLRLGEASGTALDHLRVTGREAIRLG